MRKISKRIFAMALAMSTLLTACGGNGGSNAGTNAGTETANTEVSTQTANTALAADVIKVDMATYDAKSTEVYNAALGEFINFASATAIKACL